MDTRTGEMYPTKQAALAAGVPELDIAELFGSTRAVGRIRRAVKAQVANRRRKAQRRQQKASRRAHRR